MKRRIITIVTLFSILLVLWGGTGISSNASGFVDVPSGAFYYDAVNWAVANNITQGTDSTHFKPNSPCIRSQIVTFIWKAYGSPEPDTEVNPFVDIQNTDYYYKAVLWAVENDITSGMDATHFKPNKPCTRAQVVTFLWNAAGKPEPLSSYNSFSDVSINAMYFKAVRWAGEQDITYGTNATHFSPSNTCSRGQIVTFIYRAVSDQIHHHDWVLSQESYTCSQGGNREYYCTTCGETKTEVIPKGHKWATKTEKIEAVPGHYTTKYIDGYRCDICGFFNTSINVFK
ncbi:MAG: S-layer homology domain-containing protein [Eubacterium sp.]|nr:S-layer homology domain-containing protein [Eubacterium sp.]